MELKVSSPFVPEEQDPITTSEGVMVRVIWQDPLNTKSNNKNTGTTTHHSNTAMDVMTDIQLSGSMSPTPPVMNHIDNNNNTTTIAATETNNMDPTFLLTEHPTQQPQPSQQLITSTQQSTLPTLPTQPPSSSSSSQPAPKKKGRPFKNTKKNTPTNKKSKPKKKKLSITAPPPPGAAAAVHPSTTTNNNTSSPSFSPTSFSPTSYFNSLPFSIPLVKPKVYKPVTTKTKRVHTKGKMKFTLQVEETIQVSEDEEEEEHPVQDSQVQSLPKPNELQPTSQNPAGTPSIIPREENDTIIPNQLPQQGGGSETKKQTVQGSTTNEEKEYYVDSMVNMALLDPPKWGWTALGGIQNVCPPLEKSKRNETQAAFLLQQYQLGRIPIETILEQRPSKSPRDGGVSRKSSSGGSSNAAGDDATKRKKGGNTKKRKRDPLLKRNSTDGTTEVIGAGTASGTGNASAATTGGVLGSIGASSEDAVVPSSTTTDTIPPMENTEQKGSSSVTRPLKRAKVSNEEEQTVNFAISMKNTSEKADTAGATLSESVSGFNSSSSQGKDSTSRCMKDSSIHGVTLEKTGTALEQSIKEKSTLEKTDAIIVGTQSEPLKSTKSTASASATVVGESSSKKPLGSTNKPTPRRFSLSGQSPKTAEVAQFLVSLPGFTATTKSTNHDSTGKDDETCKITSVPPPPPPPLADMNTRDESSEPIMNSSNDEQLLSLKNKSLSMDHLKKDMPESSSTSSDLHFIVSKNDSTSLNLQGESKNTLENNELQALYAGANRDDSVSVTDKPATSTMSTSSPQKEGTKPSSTPSPISSMEQLLASAKETISSSKALIKAVGGKVDCTLEETEGQVKVSVVVNGQVCGLPPALAIMPTVATMGTATLDQKDDLEQQIDTHSNSATIRDKDGQSDIVTTKNKDANPNSAPTENKDVIGEVSTSQSNIVDTTLSIPGIVRPTVENPHPDYPGLEKIDGPPNARISFFDIISSSKSMEDETKDEKEDEKGNKKKKKKVDDKKSKPNSKDAGSNTKRQSNRKGGKKNEKPVAEPKPEVYYRPQALTDDQQINIFAYHRGVEGYEPRNEKTGKLLADEKMVMDTNHDWDVNPTTQMKLKVKVKFPLCSPSDIDDDGFSYCKRLSSIHTHQTRGARSPAMNPEGNCRRKIKRRKRMNITPAASASASSDTTSSNVDVISSAMGLSSIPYFEQAVEWDLADPHTPTPMIYASKIAINFGLSFHQTLDLAALIQKQIDTFCLNKIKYRMPMTTHVFSYEHEGKMMLREVKDSAAAAQNLVQHPQQPAGFALPKLLQGGHCAQTITTLVKSCMSKNVNNSKVKVKVGRVGGRPGASSKPTEKVQRSAKKQKPKKASGGGVSVRKSTGGGSRFSNTRKYSKAIPKVYVDEIVRRAKQSLTSRVAQHCIECPDDTKKVGFMSVLSNVVCHICHIRKPSGVVFLCRNERHSYCDMHCQTRLGFSLEDVRKNPKQYDSCPVCDMNCYCAGCARKLDKVGHQFKEACVEQGVGPAEVNYKISAYALFADKGPDAITSNPQETYKSTNKKRKLDTSTDSKVFKLPRYDDSESTTSKAGVKKTKSSVKKKQILSPSKRGNQTNKPKHPFKPTRTVTKVPPDAFPVETMDGQDKDPSLPDDHRTVFTPNGSFLTEASKSENKDDLEVQALPSGEDGNISYCSVCEKDGELLTCCDVCPRAYCEGCLKATKSSLPDLWKCERCEKDESETDGKRTGEEYLTELSKTFSGETSEPDYSDKMVALSKIFESIIHLMGYEFGEVFAEPVSTTDLPDYRQIIKHPMDLGTMKRNVLNRKYIARAEKFKNENPTRCDGASKLDIVVLEILKDLELIWHNCLTYNSQGSCFHRMGQVLRKRSNVFRRCSFDGHLNGFIKKELGQYVAECKMERTSNRPGKVEVNTKVVEAVGILDPRTNMVVKQYSSHSAVCLVVKLLKKNGHLFEFPIKKLTKELYRFSRDDPSILFFGYRWIFMDDIRNGNFVVEKTANIDGKVVQEEGASKEGKAMDDASGGNSTKVEKTAANDKIIPEKSPNDDKELICKNSTESNSKLKAFKTIDEAYVDWLETMKNSNLSADNELSVKSIETFREAFLEGGQSINNIRWGIIDDKGDSSEHSTSNKC